MAVASIVRRIFRETSQIDRSTIEPGYAARCTAGVAIPLVVALAAGYPLSGVSAAIGAMVVGFASRQGVYRTRAAVTIVTAASTGLAAFLGSITGGDIVLNIAVCALWGLAFGIFASLGAAANAVGLNGVVTLVIFSQFGYSFAQAGEQALLVVGGGLLQTVLLVAVWPLARFTTERTALARAFRALGDYALHIPAINIHSPDADTLSRVSSALADPQPFAKRGETAVFEALLDEAERIRATLAALATDLYLLVSHTILTGVEPIQLVCSGAQNVLVEIADALEHARPPQGLTAEWAALDAHIEELERARDSTDPLALERGTLTQALADGRALAGQLRSAWHAVSTPADTTATLPPRKPGVSVFGPSLITDALQTLRANCSPQSTYGQHGLRLGATLAVASAAEHLLPMQRAYWIPLTAALVLRPDFSATFTRGLARVTGTVVGAVAAWLIAYGIRPGPEGYLVLAIIAAALGYLIFTANYALYTVAVTMYVVFLLAFGGLPEHTAILDRVAASLVGGVMALLAYLVWPTWERERVPAQLATLLDKERAYGTLVLRGYSDPMQRDDHRIYTAQLAVRMARSNAEASVDRMLGEPVRPRAVTVRAALGILAASRRFGLAVLTLQARLPRATTVPHPALHALTAELDAGMAMVAAALRKRSAPVILPALRARHVELQHALVDDAIVDIGVLISETDLMVDSVDTIADLLARARREPGDPPSRPASVGAGSGAD